MVPMAIDWFPLWLSLRVAVLATLLAAGSTAQAAKRCSEMPVEFDSNGNK